MLTGGLFVWNSRTEPTPLQNPLKSQVDSLLSIKRGLENDLGDARSQLEDVKQENASLNSQISNLDKLLSQNYDQLKTHYGDNIDHTFAMKGMTSKVARLSYLHDSVTNQLTPLQQKADRLSKSNDL